MVAQEEIGYGEFFCLAHMYRHGVECRRILTPANYTFAGFQNALRQDPPPPFEAILVILGPRALIFFLFESSWKKMKNDTTFVRMRSGDHLGDAKMSKRGTSLRRI